jgi:hypothetical protein
MRFAPFNGTYTGFPDRLQAAGFSLEVNRWQEVYDFNDVEKTHRNWSVISEAQREEQWVIGCFEKEINREEKQETVPAALITEGMIVEARFGGGGAFFPGTVQAVNADGSYNIKVNPPQRSATIMKVSCMHAVRRRRLGACGGPVSDSHHARAVEGTS